VIVFELICADRHRFEGWFASAGDFEGQKGRGLLSCPPRLGSVAAIGEDGRPEPAAPGRAEMLAPRSPATRTR
jgi:hypothetical protein